MIVRLTIFVGAIGALATPAFSASRWSAPIEEAARRFALPEAWIERVIRVESAGQTRMAGRPIRSAAGAMGLMQLMPATWADMRAALHLGQDPDNPRDNILAGAAYLRAMEGRFGYPGLFGAYNAGPARYARYLSGLEPLPGETGRYMAAVTDGTTRPPSHGDSALFAVRAVSTEKREPVPAGLFFMRNDWERSPVAQSAQTAPAVQDDGRTIGGLMR